MGKAWVGTRMMDEGQQWGSRDTGTGGTAGGRSPPTTPSPDSTSSLARAQSPLLLLQVGSHFRLPEAFQVIEARGQIPGHLVGPDTIRQLVPSLWPLAFLWGLCLGHGALRKPAKVRQCAEIATGGVRVGRKGYWVKCPYRPVLEGMLRVPAQSSAGELELQGLEWWGPRGAGLGPHRGRRPGHSLPGLGWAGLGTRRTQPTSARAKLSTWHFLKQTTRMF